MSQNTPVEDDSTRPMCASHFTAMRLESIGWTCMACDSDRTLSFA
ncbi:MAG: hypothetical protein JWP66_827 [Naasia sp.]|nr:hypothetical protein [Naasia sp.]